MPEINVLPQSLDPGTAAGPEALVETPGALAVRLFAATMRATGRVPAAGGAMLVPASDIRAFDAALEAAEGDGYGLGMSVAQPTPGPGPGSLPRMPSGTPGSMAEMTQTLGVYRDANAIAQPTHASAPHSAATLTQQPTLVSAPQTATVSTPLPATATMPPTAAVPSLPPNPAPVHSAATLTQQPTLVSAPQPATVSTPLPAAAMMPPTAAVPTLPSSRVQDQSSGLNGLEPAAVMPESHAEEVRRRPSTGGQIASTPLPAAAMMPPTAAVSTLPSSRVQDQSSGLNGLEPAAVMPEAHAEEVRRRPSMGAQADTESSEVAAAAVPGLALDTVLPGLAPIPVASVPVPGVVAQAVAMPPQGPLASRLDAAAIVQQVTRALAVRDLEALDAGREVVLRLDETLLPQTVLSFKPMSVAVPGAGVGTDGAAATPQVLVSLETRSDEVRAFLDTHGETLIAAMAREAPGLHWVRGAANSWLDRSAAVPVEPALTLAQATTGDSTPPVLAAGSTSASNSQGGASRERDAEPGLQGDRGGSGTQDRGSSSGSSAGQGQGRDDNPPAAVAGALDDAARARARAAESWSGLSEAARQQAARAFTDAVDGRA